MTNLGKSLLSKKSFILSFAFTQYWSGGLFLLSTFLLFIVFLNFQIFIILAGGLIGFIIISHFFKKGWLLNYESSQVGSNSTFNLNAQPIGHTSPKISLDDELQALKTLNEHQQTLISMLVHDLKTPLSNILGLTEGNLEDTSQKKIYEAGQYMLQLTMNMLEVQKMKTTSFRPNITSQNVQSLISNALTQVSGIAQTKNINIRLEGIMESVSVDTQLTQRILINLLSNAIKFSPNNSDILIKTEKTHNTSEKSFLKILVVDEGSGITIEEQPKIFDQFYQGKQENNPKNIPGSGLGLAFCKMAIEAQGGQIGLHSNHHQGSTFWFTIPTSDVKNVCVTESTYIESSSIPFKPKELILSDEDKKMLAPWKARLGEYEVYQLSKIKAILKDMHFPKESNCFEWKLAVEQALYATNQHKYQQLLK